MIRLIKVLSTLVSLVKAWFKLSNTEINKANLWYIMYEVFQIMKLIYKLVEEISSK